LSHLEGEKAVSVAVFVVRYYGGIKLGTGGLARAYGGAAKLLFSPLAEQDESGVWVEYSVCVGVRVSYAYKDTGAVERWMTRFGDVRDRRDRFDADGVMTSLVLGEEAAERLMEEAKGRRDVRVKRMTDYVQ